MKKTIGNEFAPTVFQFVPLAPEIMEAKKRLSRLRKRRIVVYRVHGQLTESAQAYLYNSACRIAISDLKQLYTKESTPYILNLFYSACRAAKLTASDSYMKNYIDNHTAVVKMQKTVVHKRKFKRIGKLRYSVAIIPYTTLELTGYGKAHVNTTDINRIDDNDGLDIIHEAYLKLLELAQNGIITDFQSVQNCTNYVYRHINAYIRKNKRISASSEDFTEFAENPYNVKYLKSEASEKAFSKIDSEAVVQAVLHYMKEKLPKNSNKENILFTFEQVALYGKTRREVADLLGISERATGKYLQVIERISSNAEVNQILHNIIFG